MLELGVAGFKPGDRVFGLAYGGAVSPTRASGSVHPIPLRKILNQF
jgi:hypothetical protein